MKDYLGDLTWISIQLCQPLDQGVMLQQWPEFTYGTLPKTSTNSSRLDNEHYCRFHKELNKELKKLKDFD